MNSIIHLKQDEEEVTAFINEIPHRSHTMYKVIFESGYENIFFTDVETGKWIEEDLGFTPLAKQFGEEVRKITPLAFHVPKILTWHKQYAEGKMLLFGFISFKKDANKMYEIYNGNKKYMYTLANMENDEWQILGKPEELLQHTDPILLRHIIRVLPFYNNA